VRDLTHLQRVCFPKHNDKFDLQIFLICSLIQRRLVLPERFAHQSFQSVAIYGKGNTFMWNGKSYLYRRRCSCFRVNCKVALQQRAVSTPSIFQDVGKNGISSEDLRFMKCVSHTFSPIRHSSKPEKMMRPDGENPDYFSSLTVSLWRPLARRRARTFLPFFVAMRARKPCAFLRFRV